MSRTNFSKSLAAMLAATAGMAAVVAEAATLGDPAAGRLYAETHCRSCHSIVPDGNTSPVDAAPPFQVVADTPGMTRTALFVFFRTPHATMPNLVIQGDDVDNVIAYILSLKSEKK